MPNSRWIAGMTGCALALSLQPDVRADGFDAVAPFIGTGGEGHAFPGATVPFGMVQLSPDTRIQPRKDAYGWAAGYRHDDDSIVGFSHTHFSGTGHSDLGDVLLMPVSGQAKLERGDPDQPGSGYTSRFSHESEQAEPGYYAVTLSDYGIRAELTASARVGMHRYAFPQGKPALHHAGRAEPRVAGRERGAAVLDVRLRLFKPVRRICRYAFSRMRVPGSALPHGSLRTTVRTCRSQPGYPQGCDWKAI